MKNKLISAIITPFDDNDEVDFKTLNILLKRIITTHDGVVIAGSTGEGESLSHLEVKSLIDFYQQFEFEKIISINEDCTYKVINQIKDLNIPKDYKIMIRVPAYYLPTDKGIINHFSKIFSILKDYQFIIYDIAKRTNSKLNYDIVKELIKYENFIAIKECNKNFELIKSFKNNIEFYCGDDLNFKEYYDYGAIGLISVFSQLKPDLFYDYVINNEHDLKLLSNIKSVISNELNPIGIKRKLKEEGFKSMNLRLPLIY